MLHRCLFRGVCDKRAICFTLVTCSVYYMISVKLSRPLVEQTTYQCSETTKSVEPMQYISPLCNCAKLIPVADELALNKSQRFRWCSLESDLRGDHQKVVTYSLYGNAYNASIFRRYYTALWNLSSTVEQSYPGWVVRIYHNLHERRDREGFKTLCAIYCRFAHVDLCSIESIWGGIGNSTSPIDPVVLMGLNRKMYRYLVMLDPKVDHFISRDVDSYIFKREVDAVNQWMESNFTFHLMRDHTQHKSYILAGMWGAKLHQRRDLIEGLCRAMIISGQNQIGTSDQATLDRILWPVAKFDVVSVFFSIQLSNTFKTFLFGFPFKMAHDSYHCQTKEIVRASPLKVFPFPTQRDGSYYIGGAGGKLFPRVCPVACRPADHKDWEYC